MKWLKRVALPVVVVLLLVAGAVFFWMPGLIRYGVETRLPAMTRTDVTLDDVDFSVLTGKAGLRGLQIGNPEGYKTPYAVKVGEVSVKLQPATLFGEVLVIDEIRVVRADVIYEFGGPGGANLRKIKQNIDAYTGRGKRDAEPATEPVPPPPDKQPVPTDEPEPMAKKKRRKVVIKRFVMERCFLRGGISQLKGESVAVALPDFELTDIGTKEKAVTAKEAASQIAGQIQKKALVTYDANAALFERVKDKAKDVYDKARDKANGIKDKAKDIFRNFID